jgi:hypothetical protein
MIDTLITKAMGFLTNPVETFQQSRADEPKAVFTYFGILLLFHAVLSAIIAALLGFGGMPMFPGIQPGPAFPVMVFFMMLVGGVICTLVFAAWLHLWVYVVGGRKGIMQTVNAVIYGSTPRLLLGWIPLLGIIFTLWSLVLGVLGIRELQEISTGKAILAVAIAVIIPIIIVILLAAYFFVSYATATPLPVTQGIV